MNDTPYGALLAAYLNLVETLHKRGVLNIADVVTGIGSSLDSQMLNKLGPITDHTNLKNIYDHLLHTEKHLKKIDDLKSQLRSGPPESASGS